MLQASATLHRKFFLILFSGHCSSSWHRAPLKSLAPSGPSQPLTGHNSQAFIDRANTPSIFLRACKTLAILFPVAQFRDVSLQPQQRCSVPGAVHFPVSVWQRCSQLWQLVSAREQRLLKPQGAEDKPGSLSYVGSDSSTELGGNMVCVTPHSVLNVAGGRNSSLLPSSLLLFGICRTSQASQGKISS